MLKEMRVAPCLCIAVLLALSLWGCPQSETEPAGTDTDRGQMDVGPGEVELRADVHADVRLDTLARELPPPPADADSFAVEALDEEVTVPPEKVPLIAVFPDEICTKEGGEPANCVLEVDPMDVPVGGIITVSFTLRNMGGLPLTITSISLEDYELAPGAEENEPSLSLELPPEFLAARQESGGLQLVPFGSGSPELPEELEVSAVYAKPVGPPGRTATILVTSDATNAPELAVGFATLAPVPHLQISPEQLDFSDVPAGEDAEEKLMLLNIGGGALKIDSFSLAGDSAFSIVVKGDEYEAVEEPAAGIQLDPPILVPPTNGTYVTVRFASTGQAEEALLTFFSNDPEAPDGVKVPLSAGQNPPCLVLQGDDIHFGGKLAGTENELQAMLHSCGPVPVEVTAIYIGEGSSPCFSIDYSSLDHVPTVDDPLSMPGGESASVTVKFAPTEPSPLAPDGTPLLDKAYLVIENSSFEPKLEIKITGACVEEMCPTAMINEDLELEVVPQTTIELAGDQSYSQGGAITQWTWDVQQPKGSKASFLPSNSAQNVTIQANASGHYVFFLTVWDESGAQSCFPAVKNVMVIPDEALHVELLWDTPGAADPDEPVAGTDLDLHFLHPEAVGFDLDDDGGSDGWFDGKWDCFEANPHPNWGLLDPAVDDDPGLDLEDHDGVGPEIVNLGLPEDLLYKIGAHYRTSCGLGASSVTARVFVYAQLVWDAPETWLVDKDMWEICTVDWATGKVKSVKADDGGPKVYPACDDSLFF